jgi:hypothetical protein
MGFERGCLGQNTGWRESRAGYFAVISTAEELQDSAEIGKAGTTYH